MHRNQVISISLHNKSHCAGISPVTKKIKQYKNTVL